jgi:hypothetical protein
MTKKHVLPFILMIGVLSLANSCKKTSLDKLIEEQYGVNGNICDTVNMKYSTNVVPILQAHCYVCHGNGNTGGSGGINLDGYDNLIPWVHNGHFLGNVRHDPGYVGMPYQMPMLDTCTISKLGAWVNRGAPND